MAIFIQNDNISIQIAAQPGAGRGSLEAAKVDAGTLQPGVAGIGRSLQCDREAPQLFYAWECSSQSAAPGNSDASFEYDAQEITPVVCQLFPAGQRGCERKRISKVQGRQSLALTAIPGCNQWVFGSGLLFSRTKGDGWRDTFQPAQRHRRNDQFLQNSPQAERMVFAGGLSIRTQAIAQNGQGDRFGFWPQEFDCGQRWADGGESTSFKVQPSQAGDSATALREAGERQSPPAEGESDGSAYSRAHRESAPGLFAQGGAVLRQQFRYHSYRGFECGENGASRMVGAVNNGCFVVNVASNTGEQSCKCWPSGACRSAAIHESKVLILRGVGSEDIERSHACLSALWICGRPGCERGKEHIKGWDTAFSEGVQL